MLDFISEIVHLVFAVIGSVFAGGLVVVVAIWYLNGAPAYPDGYANGYADAVADCTLKDGE